jgi:hypothetical protein
MYQDRKKLQIQTKVFSNFRVNLKIENDGTDFETFQIWNFSEDGSNLFTESNSIPFEIGDKLLGTLVERNDGVLIKFSATIVWKEGSNMGIKFHEELILPDSFIALQMTLID